MRRLPRRCAARSLLRLAVEPVAESEDSDMELIVGPRVRLTPFIERAVAAGLTKATVYNHTVLPVSTDDPAADYRALTTAAAIWDVGCERQVQIAGPDAHRLVTYLCARDLRDLPIGAVRYAPMCDYQGRLVNDPMALRIDETTFWLSIADSDVLWWARAVAGQGDYDVQVTEPDVWPLAIQGPRGPDVVAAALGEWVHDVRFFRFVRHVHDGIPLLVCRSGWSGQGGFELFLMDGSKGEQLWDLLWEAGRPFGLAVGAPNNAERIESFLLSFGGDTDAETDPDEAGLSRFVDLSSGGTVRHAEPVGVGDDATPGGAGRVSIVGDAAQTDAGRVSAVDDAAQTGVGRVSVVDDAAPNVADADVGHDFIGKAALAARRASGAQRRLVGLVIEGDPPSPLRSPRAVHSPDGRSVGTLRALTRSPRFDANLGLALLDPPWYAPDTAVRVEFDGTLRAAVTASLPFDLPQPPAVPEMY